MKVAAKVTLGLSALVLVGGIALAVLGTRPPPEPKFKGRLIDLLPTAEDLPGWTVNHLPVADTPEMQAKVDELLSYDQAEFVQYTQGELAIRIYVAYWRPGGKEVRSVARHTPDRCWILAGWERIHREDFPMLAAGDRFVGFTEHRKFKLAGIVEDVVFWHLAGGEIVSYRTGGELPWYAALAETLRWGNAIKQEQFFVRISANKSLESYWNQPMVQQLVFAIPDLARPRL